MDKASPFVITISRQLGSGGAYLGQRLAFRLNALYLDHQIVFEAAKELKIPEEDVVFRDEKVTSRWHTILNSIMGSSSWFYAPPPPDVLKDSELYNSESNIITQIAKEHNAVIVGRAGYYVLRKYPRCLNVFLHADIKFRQRRVEELYHKSPQEALKMISSIDQDRALYLRQFTGQNWLDTTHYHLSLDTSAVGLWKAEAIILETLQARFNDIILEDKR